MNSSVREYNGEWWLVDEDLPVSQEHRERVLASALHDLGLDKLPTDAIYLLRPCWGSYTDKRGRRRHLRPNFGHGAWVIGPDSPVQLSYVQGHADVAVGVGDMPVALAAVMETKGARGIYFAADRLRELGWPVAEIPVSGWRRWWWLFVNDAGGMR